LAFTPLDSSGGVFVSTAEARRRIVALEPCGHPARLERHAQRPAGAVSVFPSSKKPDTFAHMEFIVSILALLYLITVWAMLYVTQRNSAASLKQLEVIVDELRKASRADSDDPNLPPVMRL
jgi:hypothetical protein